MVVNGGVAVVRNPWNGTEPVPYSAVGNALRGVPGVPGRFGRCRYRMNVRSARTTA
jgi:hypothetical protein